MTLPVTVHGELIKQDMFKRYMGTFPLVCPCFSSVGLNLLWAYKIRGAARLGPFLLHLKNADAFSLILSSGLAEGVCHHMRSRGTESW